MQLHTNYYKKVSQKEETTEMRENRLILEENLKYWQLVKKKTIKELHQEKNWQKATEFSKEIYAGYGEIIIPKCENFEKELQIQATEAKKQEKIILTEFQGTTKSALRFIGEPRPQGYTDIHIKTKIAKMLYESTATSGDIHYLLLTEERPTETKAKIIGTEIKMLDEQRIGDSTGIPRHLSIILVKKIVPIQISQKRVLKAIDGIKNEEDLKAEIFSIYQHPAWFENLVSAWLLSSKSTYPLHLLIADKSTQGIAQGSVGKSVLLERLNLIAGNEQKIFDLSEGSIKGLTLSLSGKRIKTGYLLNQPHTAYIDEFFKVKQKADRQEIADEFFGILKNILEHRARFVNSGIFEQGATITPRAKCFFAGNMPRGIETLYELTEIIEETVLQRMMIYIYTDKHKHQINKKKAEVTHLERKGVHEQKTTNLKDFLDYCYELRVNYNPETEKKINDLYAKNTETAKSVSWEKFFGKEETERQNHSYKISDIYQARHQQHIANLIDGLTKLNNLEQLKNHIKKHGTKKKTWEHQPGDLEFEQAQEIIENELRSW